MSHYAKEQSPNTSASFQRIPANGNKAEAKLREVSETAREYLAQIIGQTADSYMQTLPANLQRYAEEFGIEVVS